MKAYSMDLRERVVAAVDAGLIRPDEAELARALGEDTLERCRRVFGLDYPTTLLAAAALTLTLVRLGEAEPARALAADTLQRCRRMLGPDHPVTLYLTQDVGIAHLRLGGGAAADGPSRPL
jgi:hypothetical protein